MPPDMAEIHSDSMPGIPLQLRFLFTLFLGLFQIPNDIVIL